MTSLILPPNLKKIAIDVLFEVMDGEINTEIYMGAHPDGGFLLFTRNEDNGGRRDEL